MAARLRKTHQADVRTKIQASQLLNVLQDHALGKIAELPATRLRAIEILLKKILPDLSQVQGTGDDGEHQLLIKIVRHGDGDA
ncbi:MAG TPA: hypothetical protein VN815_18940 [Steroidobacteraceae bacterium]|nr:hypothetical protein [Steroidobacteraceae bacterium]